MKAPRAFRRARSRYTSQGWVKKPYVKAFWVSLYSASWSLENEPIQTYQL